ncbi:asparaginase [Alkalicoccus luteus]|uniref:asparaginase n=1 Tax=Alkalicoccus luteus TaxID=1237094 RepID=A0A969TVJ4_9BACI|nr:asparaginase [Alkalicoccus luteus]NJP38167.1 asparaginase [Alkalicoccus luteus]
MKKVTVLTTGGTIASSRNEKGRLEAGIYTGEELAAKLRLPEDIEVKVVSVLQKASIHITLSDIDLLREQIQEDGWSDGFVVTHGTDTLEESAYYFDLTYNGDRPVVFTGSQRSPDQLGSDAFINLRHAVYTAASSQVSGIGTVVVFNERIFSAEYVKKEHASNVQGFNAFGFGYLGIIDNDVVHMYQRPIRREYFSVNQAASPRVILIKAHVEADDLLINACIDKHVDGIVLEGLGRGQVTKELAAACGRAVRAGIPIVLTTASEEGHVYTTYDYEGSAYDLINKGVLLGRDADSKKARIRLTACLKAGLNPVDYFGPIDHPAT